MKIVTIEDRGVTSTVIGHLQRHISEINHFDAGQSFGALASWLDKHPGPTVIITASTIDAQRGNRGSAYDDLRKWLQSPALRDEQRRGLSVIAHPTNESAATNGFKPYDRLVETCYGQSIRVYRVTKEEGLDPLLKVVRSIFEGASIEERKRSRGER